MLTKNFKQAVSLLLTSYRNRSKGGLEIKALDGTTRYLMSFYGWPRSGDVVVEPRIQNDNNYAGIYVGSGSRAASEDDYALESKITTGLSAHSTIITDESVDENGNPQLKIVLTLTNTSNADITVGELGYAQQFNTAVSATGNSISVYPSILLDRTVLNTPVTIPPGESAAITYTFKTVLS